MSTESLPSRNLCATGLGGTSMEKVGSEVDKRMESSSRVTGPW